MERLTERDGILVKSRFSGDFATQNILQRLADYEEAEEQGLLLRLPCKVGDERIRKLVAEELATKGENDFVKEVYANDVRDPLDILNWYRNFYCKEGLDTERGLMVNTINDLFMKLNARTE